MSASKRPASKRSLVTTQITCALSCSVILAMLLDLGVPLADLSTGWTYFLITGFLIVIILLNIGLAIVTLVQPEKETKEQAGQSNLASLETEKHKHASKTKSSISSNIICALSCSVMLAMMLDLDVPLRDLSTAWPYFIITGFLILATLMNIVVAITTLVWPETETKKQAEQSNR